MGESVEEIKRNYQEKLNPIDYHKFITGGCDDEEMHKYLVTSLTAIYELVKSEKFKGRKLLEIGSGATIHNIASAANYFTEIVQSDFVETNCEELRKWLRGESQLDWSVFLKIVAKIEGIDDSSSGLKKIEDRIRKSVKSVVHCDLLLDEVVPKEVAVEYDLIVTALTLEAVALDFENYVTILKRLNRLLRPGGGLVIIGFLNGGKWSTEGGEFHHIKISQEEVDKALDLAGFKDKHWIRLPKTQEITMVSAYDYDAYFYVASEKF